MKTGILLLVALWLFIAPWPTSPSHLLEKITWIQTGHPMKVIDWFDIFMHGGIPIGILGWTLNGFLQSRKQSEA